jgi:hypothetical protein
MKIPTDFWDIDLQDLYGAVLQKVARGRGLRADGDTYAEGVKKNISQLRVFHSGMFTFILLTAVREPRKYTITTKGGVVLETESALLATAKMQHLCDTLAKTGSV